MRRINRKVLFGLILSILLSVAFSVVWASGGFVEIEISPRGTYLRADPGGEGRLPVDSPAIVDLQSNDFSEGDTILISLEGSLDYGDGVARANYSLGGVFSSTNQLLPISEAERVPGAIDAGNDYVTGQTFFTHENTDIPEDFLIPSTGLSVKVPQNAKYLFMSPWDSFYPDNTAPSSIKATIEKQVSEPTDGFPLEYMLAAIGVVAIIAVLLVFVMLRRRKPRTQSNP